LRLLKQRHADFVASLSSLFEAETAEKQRWPHHLAVGPSGRRGSSNSEDYFATAYRNVVSRFGNVLEGFDLLSRMPVGRVPRWEKKDASTWRYTINTGFDHRAFPTVVAYWSLLSELDKLENERKKAAAALEQAKARELFDSA
jgi:hypothetical protein